MIYVMLNKYKLTILYGQSLIDHLMKLIDHFKRKKMVIFLTSKNFNNLL